MLLCSFYSISGEFHMNLWFLKNITSVTRATLMEQIGLLSLGIRHAVKNINNLLPAINQDRPSLEFTSFRNPFGFFINGSMNKTNAFCLWHSFLISVLSAWSHENRKEKDCLDYKFRSAGIKTALVNKVKRLALVNNVN